MLTIRIILPQLDLNGSAKSVIINDVNVLDSILFNGHHHSNCGDAVNFLAVNDKAIFFASQVDNLRNRNMGMGVDFSWSVGLSCSLLLVIGVRFKLGRVEKITHC